MLPDQDDITQQIHLRHLEGTRQTRRQIVADMLRSRAWSYDKYRLNKSCIIPDYDSLIDLESFINLLDKHKAIILKLEYQGYTQKEMSKMLGITQRAVINRRNNAIKEIKEYVLC